MNNEYYSDPINLEVAGTKVVVRTMTPADRDIESDFVSNLSDRSRYFRFHGPLKELSSDMLDQFTHVNYPGDLALIATIEKDGVEKEIGVARYVKLRNSKTAEVAVVVADEWQGNGIATSMLKQLRRAAVDGGIEDFYMTVLSENHGMIKLARSVGFKTQPFKGDYTTRQLGKSIRDYDDT